MTSISASGINTTDYHNESKPLWNIVACTYVLVGYLSGILLLFSMNWVYNILGIFFLTHCLVLSTYLTHEFIHGTIFAKMRWNRIGGTVMLWLNGGCYFQFQALAKKHIAHHIDRVDFTTFDLANFINRLPSPIRQFVLILEWFYFPAISLILRWQAILSPFFRDQHQYERSRVLFILAIRGLGFGLLGYLSVKALLLYFLGYIGYITVERMMDAFQHTYDVFPVGVPLPKRDYAYEQANTFSSLFPEPIAWLNLLLLNFGYHNAHHELISCPWYHLPQLQKDLAKKRVIHCINPLQLLVNYHCFRIQRIFLGQGKAVNFQGEFDFDRFYGAIDVSIIVQY